ncbi:uncharacterized protein (TIGR00369 family) [Sphingomonas vulcanisoli]|uniref:Uncharacterized protein (TIGR00369 family) n=1 Tax=Sphingomonas vulcanisoli TaxID=1658060 RepID=A0ABX0TTX3_9SPHN|nr:uncharacterized protein (TIGR00369 family) [Sphingomonas vulcanisoli]
MASSLPSDIAQLVASRSGHTVALGIRYAAHGADWAELTLDYDRRLISDLSTGILASGPIVSLMDTVCGTAVWLKRGEFLQHATLDLRIDYLRPAQPGHRVTGRGECYRLTRRIAFTRGMAHDGDPHDPIAHVTATFMLSAEGFGAAS